MSIVLKTGVIIINFAPSSQGVYKIPRFRVKIDPNTNEVRPGTAQIENLQTYHDIPFSKEKVKELLDMFSEELEPEQGNLSVVDSSERRHSCNVDEFVNEEYQKLVDMKTGFTEWSKERSSSKKR